MILSVLLITLEDMVWYKKGVNCIELLAGGINIVWFRLECGLT